MTARGYLASRSLQMLKLEDDTLQVVRLVEHDVRGQDQRAQRRDPQPLEHRHPALDERLALGEQRLERQHYPVADEAADLLAQDARRDERQDRLATADDQRVPRVVAALKARHRRGPLGQQGSHVGKLAGIQQVGFVAALLRCGPV